MANDLEPPHTLAGFKSGFSARTGRQPSEQEIFNAGVKSGVVLKREADKPLQFEGNEIELKTDGPVFDAVWDERKTHEIRFNDREFQVGDRLWLRETVHTGEEMRDGHWPLVYTGRNCIRTVSHVLEGYGLLPGWVILSFAPLHRELDEPLPQDGDWPTLRPLHLQALMFAYNEGYSKAYERREFPNPFSTHASQAAACELGKREGTRIRDWDDATKLTVRHQLLISKRWVEDLTVALVSDCDRAVRQSHGNATQPPPLYDTCFGMIVRRAIEKITIREG